MSAAPPTLSRRRRPAGHAPNLPLGALPNPLSGIKALPDGPVILVCRTDKRSAKAAEIVRTAGFSNVTVLRGGMERWNRAGLPVESRAA